MVEIRAGLEMLPLAGKKEFEIVDGTLVHRGGNIGLQQLQHGAGTLVTGGRQDIDDLRPLLGGDGGVAQALLQEWQNLRRSQFPHQTGDAIVPFRKVLVEVGEDDFAPLLIVVSDGDADGGEVEAVLAVVVACEYKDPFFGLLSGKVAEQE